MLAVGALIASLFAVGATPAAAVDEDSKQDKPATASACVGDATADRGFTDIGGWAESSQAAINCMGYYGITAGTSTSTYGPDDPVNRWQMALFLHNAATRAGVDLDDSDDATLSDIGDLNAFAQGRISDIVGAGIMGSDNGNFNPNQAVTRADMAHHLVSLLDLVVDYVTKEDNGLFTVDVGDDGTVDVFADAGINVAQRDSNAASSAYELGITGGVGGGNFDPDASVSRGQMALFITAALGHTNLRPAGLSAQAAGSTVTASMRTDDFQPIANSEIDMFYASAEDVEEGDVFDEDGACTSAAVLVDGAGTTACMIDPVDIPTNSLGNASLTVVNATDGPNVWVWTGSSGDEYEDGETDAVVLTLDPAMATGATASRGIVTTEFKTGLHAHFGSTVSFTLQLQGANPADVDEFISAGPADDDSDQYTLVVRILAAADAAPAAALSVATSTLTVDENGTATFTMSVSDPNTQARGQTRYAQYAITGLDKDHDSDSTTDNVEALPVQAADLDDPSVGLGPSSIITFSDVAPGVTALEAEASRSYVEAPTAEKPSGNAIVVTARDQYGATVANAPIVLTSETDPANSGTATPPSADRPRLTGPDGSVRISYAYTVGTDGGDGTETATATWTNPDDDSVTAKGEAKVYWYTVVIATDTDDDGDANPVGDDGNLVAGSVEDKTLIVDTTDGPRLVKYDGNDVFLVGEVYVTLVGFEKELGERLAMPAGTVTWAAYTNDASAVSLFTLGDLN